MNDGARRTGSATLEQVGDAPPIANSFARCMIGVFLSF
jgi:hypothetical protein